MFLKQIAKQLMAALPSGKRFIRGQPRTRWGNYAEDLAWSHLGISPAKLLLVAGDKVAGDKDAWRSQLELLPLQPKRISGQREIHYTNLMFFLKMMINAHEPASSICIN